jgi:hypothetical protein
LDMQLVSQRGSRNVIAAAVVGDFTGWCISLAAVNIFLRNLCSCI